MLVYDECCYMSLPRSSRSTDNVVLPSQSWGSKLVLIIPELTYPVWGLRVRGTCLKTTCYKLVSKKAWFKYWKSLTYDLDRLLYDLNGLPMLMVWPMLMLWPMILAVWLMTLIVWPLSLVVWLTYDFDTFTYDLGSLTYGLDCLTLDLDSLIDHLWP